MSALPPLLPASRQPEDPLDCSLCPATERRDQPVALVTVALPDGWRVTEEPLCRVCETRSDLPDVFEERRLKAGGEPAPIPLRREVCRVCGSESSCDCERHDPFGERRERRNDEGKAAA